MKPVLVCLYSVCVEVLRRKLVYISTFLAVSEPKVLKPIEEIAANFRKLLVHHKNNQLPLKYFISLFWLYFFVYMHVCVLFSQNISTGISGLFPRLFPSIHISPWQGDTQGSVGRVPGNRSKRG